MGGATTGAPGELFADPSLRYSPRERRSETGQMLEGAAHALAGAMSHSYRRMARFMGEGATAVRAGSAQGGEALRDLRRHFGTLRSAARSGIREAVLAEGRAADMAFGSARWGADGARGRGPLSGPARDASAALHGRIAAVDSFARAKMESDGDEFDFFGRASADRVSRARAAAEARVARGEEARPAHLADAPSHDERTRVVSGLAARLRRACAGASLGVLMTLRAAADRAVSAASRARRFVEDGARRVHCGATVAAWRLQDSPSARFHARAVAALGVAAAVVAVGYGNAHHIADGLQSVAQHAPNVSTADLAEHGERASRFLSSTWTRFASSVGDALGGTAPGTGVVEAAHVNAADTSAHALATTSLPLPPPAPPAHPAGTGLGHHAAGAARRAASAASDLGATEALNRRSLDAARRGGEMLSRTETLNAGELARVRAGGPDPMVGAVPMGTPAPAGHVTSSPLPPIGAGKAAAVAQHAPSGVATKPLAGGHAAVAHAAPGDDWFGGGRSGGLLERLRSMASAAADKVSLGGPNGAYDVRPPQLAQGRVTLGPRPF